jgi:hypothetical protein
MKKKKTSLLFFSLEILEGFQIVLLLQDEFLMVESNNLSMELFRETLLIWMFLLSDFLFIGNRLQYNYHLIDNVDCMGNILSVSWPIILAVKFTSSSY